MSRQVFTNGEKRCLQELIIKYKLNNSATIGARTPAAKKTAWALLTNEFNSIETNTRRTEPQLKKCYDNMKTRRKAALTAQKKDRMRTGGRPYRPGPKPKSVPAPDDQTFTVLVIQDRGEEDREGHSEGTRNIRAQVIQDLKEEQYKKSREREEELHKLKVAEREWLAKAAEEIYKKACLEREAAQITLDALKNKLFLF